MKIQNVSQFILGWKLNYGSMIVHNDPWIFTSKPRWSVLALDKISVTVIWLKQHEDLQSTLAIIFLLYKDVLCMQILHYWKELLVSCNGYVSSWAHSHNGCLKLCWTENVLLDLFGRFIQHLVSAGLFSSCGTALETPSPHA